MMIDARPALSGRFSEPSPRVDSVMRCTQRKNARNRHADSSPPRCSPSPEANLPQGSMLAPPAVDGLHARPAFIDSTPPAPRAPRPRARCAPASRRWKIDARAAPHKMKHMDTVPNRDRHARESLILLRRAIGQGWDIPASIMQDAPNTASEILQNGTAREQLRAMEVLIRMRDSNIAAAQVADKIDRLDDGTPTDIYTLGKIEL